MTLVALFAGEHGLLASRRAVFGADELQALERAGEAAERLDALLGEEHERVLAAEAEGARCGHAEGVAAGEREAGEAGARALHEMQGRFAAELRRLEDESVSMALEIVRRIAGDVAPAAWLAAQARRAAEELVEQAPLALRVHPERVEAVREALGAAPTVFDDVGADESLAPEDCVIETRFGRIDTALETQLARIRELGASEPERGHG